MMDGTRFDNLARRVARLRSRRDVLRGVAVVATGAITTRIGERQVAAETPPPIPTVTVNTFEFWPVCSNTQRFYCIESFSVDGVDQLTKENPDFVPSVVASLEFAPSGFGEADRVEWWVLPATGELQPTDLRRDFRLRFRSGRLEPAMTHMQAADFSMNVSGSEASGWLVDLRGKPAVVPGVKDVNNLERADLLFIKFQGQARHRTSIVFSQMQGFEGYIAVDSVLGSSSPAWHGQGWNVLLESVHWLPDGEINHGSYRAWIAPAALQRLKLSPSNAIRGELLVSRIDDGVESTVAATLSEQDGGVLIDIPDLTFSSPTISMRRRGKGGCAKKCKKGRVCKNGHCKKKKKKKKKNKRKH